MSAKYSQTMKTLEVILSYLNFMNKEELKTCIDCISRFENAKQLTLKVVSMIIKEPIDDYLSLIGQKCNKIVKLDLTIDSFVTISDRFFDVFTQFKAIKKLKIELYHNTVVKRSVESLKHCKQLKDLVITYDKLREDFFANIATFIPKLEFLAIKTEKQYSDSFIDPFHSMTNIRKVNHFVQNKHFQIIGRKYWYFGKSLIEVMLSPNGKHVIRVNDNCGLIAKHK